MKTSLHIIMALLALCLLAGGQDMSERKAIREKILSGNSVEKYCREGMKSNDSLIRRHCLAMLYYRLGNDSLPEVIKALMDSDGAVRLLAVSLLGNHITPETVDLLNNLAETDPVEQVRFQARHAIWPFHRKNQLLKNDASWDHLVKEIASCPLPLHNWKFQADPQGNGHLKGFQTPDFDASAWQTLSVGKAWPAPVPSIGWYRITFNVQKPAQVTHAFELFIPLSGGDWDAWLNGIYLGASDSNREDGGFRLDASNEVKPEGDNVLLLRGHGQAAAQGLPSAPILFWME